MTTVQIERCKETISMVLLSDMTSGQFYYETSTKVTATSPATHDDILENETENDVKPQLKQNVKNDAMFTEELCSKLRVPCRFVTEHPCCALPQTIGMVARCDSDDTHCHCVN